MTKKRKEGIKEMKLIRLLLVIMAAAVITLALGGNGLAFHEEGVAYCAGCHTMHNSRDGQPITDTPGGYLLLEGSATSTCLSCHAAYGQFAGGQGYGGGGDYYWITKDFTWSAHGSTRSSLGDDHGHNVVAPELGLNQDKVLSKAPGGSFSSANLSCSSCHDPHGKGDAPYLFRNNENYFGAVFPSAPVMATLSRRTTPGQSGSVSDTNHPAYGSGMSAWCAACHTTFDDGLASHMHPVNQTLGSVIAQNYNQYISTEDPTGGSKTGAYWEFVPFETGQDEATLDTSSTEGPDAGSKVMCLTCHRAHASAFPNAVRWDATTELLVESHPDGGLTDNSTLEDKTNSYYGTSVEVRWGTEQRSLCNKCHAQDGVHSG